MQLKNQFIHFLSSFLSFQVCSEAAKTVIISTVPNLSCVIYYESDNYELLNQ